MTIRELAFMVRDVFNTHFRLVRVISVSSRVDVYGPRRVKHAPPFRGVMVLEAFKTHLQFVRLWSTKRLRRTSNSCVYGPRNVYDARHIGADHLRLWSAICSTRTRALCVPLHAMVGTCSCFAPFPHIAFTSSSFILQPSDPQDVAIVDVPAESFYGKGYEDCDRRIPDITKARYVRLRVWLVLSAPVSFFLSVCVIVGVHLSVCMRVCACVCVCDCVFTYRCSAYMYMVVSIRMSVRTCQCVG